MYVDVPHLDCLLVAAPITVEGLDHLILKPKQLDGITAVSFGGICAQCELGSPHRSFWCDIRDPPDDPPETPPITPMSPMPPPPHWWPQKLTPPPLRANRRRNGRDLVNGGLITTGPATPLICGRKS